MWCSHVGKSMHSSGCPISNKILWGQSKCKRKPEKNVRGLEELPKGSTTTLVLEIRTLYIILFLIVKAILHLQQRGMSVEACETEEAITRHMI